MSGPTRLDLAIETALTAGLATSAVLLVLGLALGSTALLKAGLLVMMLTPVVRAVVVTVGLLLRRDWAFAAVSFAILGVLGSSLLAAARIAASRP
jgi:uncharacterized membrane protein